MSELKIYTNNVPRDVIYWYELTDKERKVFDYLKTEDEQAEHSFVRYKGEIYDLNDFECSNFHNAPAAFLKWDGYQSDSYFSGILIRYPRDGRDSFDTDHVVVGRYCS